MRFLGMNDCLGLIAQHWELTREMYDSRKNEEAG
jgi:hypothetical protein